jgi:GntR family transcriptional regulator, histidine utilization repressor
MPISSPAPLYEQVKAHVLERIANGTFRPGQKIVSENELAANLGVSRLTVHRGLRELTSAGVLQRIHGVGTFVAPPKSASPLIRLHNIADEIRARGQRLTIEIQHLSEEKAPSEIAREMEIRANQKLFRSILIYFADHHPVQIEDRFVLPQFAPAYLKQNFREQSTTDYLQSIAFPTRSENELQAVLPTTEEAKLLRIPKSEPCILVSRRTWVNDRVTTVSRFLHPGSRHRFMG